MAWAESTRMCPDAPTLARFERAGLAPFRTAATAAGLLRRPEVDWAALSTVLPDVPEISPLAAEQVETDIKYAGYLHRAEARAAKARRMEGVPIPPDLDFCQPGVSTEVAERLSLARPPTLGAAARLPGVTPAAIDLLAIHLARRLGR